MPKKQNYKYIFVEDLPKWDYGEFMGCINWSAINNTPVRFQYNDFNGIFTAKYFDKEKQQILVEYNGAEILCHRSTFKRSNISRIIGAIQSDYRYKIGDTYINAEKDANFTIVDRKIDGRKKLYKYICNNCGFDCRKETYYKGELMDYWVAETNLKIGISCPCCGLKRTFAQEGITDIATTSPWMIPYFEGGHDEAKMYLDKSDSKKYFTCPECGRQKK